MLATGGFLACALLPAAATLLLLLWVWLAVASTLLRGMLILQKCVWGLKQGSISM
jgi:hypothetical protein